VHAYIAVHIGRYKPGWELFMEALKSDYVDIQGGSTAEGIHTGVMGGTVLMAMTTFGGLNVQDKIIDIDPALPGHWRSITFNFNYRGNEYKLSADHSKVSIISSSSNSKEKIIAGGKEYELNPGEEQLIIIRVRP
jgi:trehalose/maltose hydrolase-like predicted phosphorylase